MKNLTVYNLRKSGYKIRVNHFRFLDRTQISAMQKQDGEWVNSKDLTPISVIRENKWQNYINSRGGLTLIEATDQKGTNYRVEARCSKKDVFSRKLALQIALGRLSKLLNFNELPAMP